MSLKDIEDKLFLSIPTATKYDTNKLPMSLLPTAALEAIADVLRFGAIKYDKYNWAKGMDWSRLTDATLRHLLAWNNGESVDKESKICHVAHAACNLVFLLTYIKYNLGNDDRHKFTHD